MPVIQDSQSVPANSTVELLANYINALVDPASRGAIIRFAYTASATGMDAEGWVGQRNPIERGGVSTQNRVPIEPDDIVEKQIPARPNERIRLYGINTTGGALTMFYRITVEEL
jgi:hypothetical protein